MKDIDRNIVHELYIKYTAMYLVNSPDEVKRERLRILDNIQSKYPNLMGIVNEMLVMAEEEYKKKSVTRYNLYYFISIMFLDLIEMLVGSNDPELIGDPK